MARSCKQVMLVFLWCLSVPMTSSAAPDANGTLLKVSFGDFQIRIFKVEQTKEWIEQHGTKIWFMGRHASLKPHPFLSELKSLLEAHPTTEKMSSKLIRF